MVHGGAPQRFLAGEVVGDQPLRHASGVGDVARGGAVEAVVGEGPQRRGDDAVTRRDGAGLRAATGRSARHGGTGRQAARKSQPRGLWPRPGAAFILTRENAVALAGHGVDRAVSARLAPGVAPPRRAARSRSGGSPRWRSATPRPRRMVVPCRVLAGKRRPRRSGVVEAVDVLALQRRSEDALDGPHRRRVLAGREGERVAGAFGPAGPAAAVHVGVHRVRDVVVDHVRHRGDVDAARCDVGRDQDARAAVAEPARSSAGAGSGSGCPVATRWMAGRRELARRRAGRGAWCG